MPFFDTHCHLDFAELDSVRAESLRAAQAYGVEKILLPGVKAKRWPRVTALVNQQPTLLCYALGLHPFWTSEHQAEDLQQLQLLLENKPSGLVAIGECGLDQVAAPELMKRQLELLEGQLELARRFDLPLTIHVRKAHPQLQSLLKQYSGVEGVIHGFSGSYELAKSYFNLGFKLGVGGTITYPRANKTREAVAKLPLEALVLETDAPDMPICGCQGQVNRPDYLPEIFAVLSELRCEKEEEVKQALWQNSLALFGIER